MDFFLHSQKAHPLVILGKRAFDALRPFWVKRMKEQNVCCYIYHVEMEELKVGFNHMRHKSKLHSISHCDWDCEVVCGYVDGLTIGYMGSQVMYFGVTKMLLVPKTLILSGMFETVCLGIMTIVGWTICFFVQLRKKDHHLP